MIKFFANIKRINKIGIEIIWIKIIPLDEYSHEYKVHSFFFPVLSDSITLFIYRRACIII